jgi:FkbM family methyltransferase
MNSDLIFDLGLHRGEDTDYYLSKGYRVVAVDADPGLIEQAAQRFGEAVREQRLTLLNCAMAAEEGEADFHLSHESAWNSLNKDISARENAAVSTIHVATRRLPDLFREFGVPLYCKIDLEGTDIVCLKTLEGSPELPASISVETECLGDNDVVTEVQALETLVQLGKLGYKRFKLVDQRSLAVLGPSDRVYQMKPSIWRRLGKRIGVGGYAHYNLYDLAEKNRSRLDAAHGHHFPDGATGPFGADLDGEWLDLHSARETLLCHRRDYFRMKDAKNYEFWCDWHASF